MFCPYPNEKTFSFYRCQSWESSVLNLYDLYRSDSNMHQNHRPLKLRRDRTAQKDGETGWHHGVMDFGFFQYSNTPSIQVPGSIKAQGCFEQGDS
jgi:hypothetical protein